MASKVELLYRLQRSRPEEAASRSNTTRISLQSNPTQKPQISHNGLVAIFRGDQGTPAARLCATFHRTPDLGQGSAYALSTMLTETATTGAHRPRHWFLPSCCPLRLPSPDHLPWLHPQQPQAQPHQVRTSKIEIRITTDKLLTYLTGCSLPSPSRRIQLDPQ